MCVNALSRAIPISTDVEKLEQAKSQYVSMPCLGLSPFLRSPLGTRINRGHNLETIHVIVRQFKIASILSYFFLHLQSLFYSFETVRLSTLLLYTSPDIPSSNFYNMLSSTLLQTPGSTSWCPGFPHRHLLPHHTLPLPRYPPSRNRHCPDRSDEIHNTL